MNIDDILSQMNKDLEQQLAETKIMMDNFTSQQATFNAGPDNAISSGAKFMFCPECGTKLAANSRFCSNCGTAVTPIHSKDEDDEDEEDFDDDDFDETGNEIRARKEEKIVGIIWTDYAVLAEKYQVKPKNVKQIVEKFANNCTKQNLDCFILDMSEHQGELGESTWMDYSEVLQKFIKKKNLKPSPKLSVFIIGGNDVIPQPAENNPCGGGDDYQDRVYADFYYCFYGKLPLEFMDFTRARCNIGRLPLEMGNMKSTLQADIDTYLSEAAKYLSKNKIKLGCAIMVSNVDWIPASREMSRNLPTPHMDDVKGETLDNMFLSPSVLVDDMKSGLKRRYYDSLKKADMLVFNLHGGCMPSQSGFYSTGLAFSTDDLSRTNAKVFNTVACWGGRYINYSRKDSMLLNALYNRHVLLYTGSCVPALGKCGCFRSDNTWRIRPAAYSETLMAYFGEYECIGTMSAGEAFLKAKCDYYNSSRSIEEDEYTLGTVLMFNLYGCPFLRTEPNVAAISAMQHRDGSKISEVPVPFRKMNRQIVMKGNAYDPGKGAASLLEEIRGAVDRELQAIHEIISKEVYDVLGLEPRDLYSVEKFETKDINGTAQSGYLYSYNTKCCDIDSSVRIKVDKNGKILDAVQTK